MKIKRGSKFLSIVSAVTVSIVSSTTVTTTVSANDNLSGEFESLKSDIEIINNVSVEDLDEFKEKNKDWLEEINIQLEEYLQQFPDEQRSDVIVNLQGENPNKRAYSGNFNWYSYTYRNGYWTYNMSPKISTRLLRPIAIDGWKELSRVYSGIRYDNGSLYKQYMCHFDALIESEWNIERGRPNVSYIETLFKLCNPR